MKIQRFTFIWQLGLWLVLGLALVSCQSNPTPTPTVSLPSTPAAEAVASSPTPPLPLVVTSMAPTLAPTATAGAGLPTATAAPTAIQGMIGPDNFPPNVNPLTGEVVADPAVLNRRPLAIKISNYPAIVRPQAGLNDADLIFEHYAEGAVTRFTAVFYSRGAQLVGSVRSARLIDLEIPVMYDAAFAYSGSSGPVRQMIANSGFFSRVISPDFGHGGFQRITDPNNPNKAIEHTLFANPDTLWAILDERGENHAPSLATYNAFAAQPPAGGAPASAVEVRYAATDVYWQYDPTSGRYVRWTDGQPHLDANTATQVNFKNVIVVAAHHEDTDILEDMVAGGHYSIQIQVWGEGPVSLFRDGQRFDGRWRRADPSHMLTFYDLNGNILPLAPGNSFVQLVPLGFTGLVVTP
ncbi:MAG: DUF3048 domain-containing protein [Chloroflexota bacterium]